jgi:hypothetical protein
MKRFVLVTQLLLAAGCEKNEPGNRSVEDPALYRPRSAQDQNGRAIFTAGLSLPVPTGASVTYLQGIDSRLMHINGQDYTLRLDDYGAFMEPATTKVAGAPASLQVGSRGGCKLRVWRLQLPGGSPAHLICSDDDADDCEHAPAQATITTFCRKDAACRQVDAVIAGLQFSPQPWPEVPLPDPQAIPKEPVCRP